jgi:hypothetical protein
MKTRFIYATAAILAFVIMPVSGQRVKVDADNQGDRRTGKTGQVALFNGKDLSNWVFRLKDPSVDPSKVFTVQNGVIHIAGQPFGYMRTKGSYSDYKLHVEWRWPSEPTNSGVFIHAQLPDTIWIKCYECQLMAGNAGDFICMGGTDMNERKNKSDIVVKKMGPSSEKPAGEWNTMEVTCSDNTVEVYVNGTLQNKGTGLSLRQGSICLQSEGKDIEFRNVFLTKLQAEATGRRNTRGH